MKKYVNFGSGIPIKMIVIAVILFLVKGVLDSLKVNRTGNRDVNDDAIKGFKEGGSIGSKEAKSIANLFEGYFNYIGIGTDTDAISKMLDKINDIDLYNVNLAFGSREYGLLGSDSILGMGTELDLAGWIEEENEFGSLNFFKERMNDAGIKM